MAATDYKITEVEKVTVHVEAQPTVLDGTPLENKQVFDSYPDLIKDKHNGLCDFVGTTTELDPTVLVLYGTLGWTAS